MSSKKSAARAAIEEVTKRREARKKQILEDQLKLLRPKLGEKKWETFKIKAGDKERIRTNLTCAGYCLYEIMDAEGITVDIRFYPYNAINGKVIQRNLGKLEKKDGKKSGQLLVSEAGKLSFIFSNEGGFFGFGKKGLQFRYVQVGDLGDEGNKSVQDTFAPQDVWWARRDPKSRKVYYINKHMKKTSWKLPPGAHLANAKYAKDVSKKQRRGTIFEDEDAEQVVGNEYQQKMNSISKGATLADLPPPLCGWFLKANRKGKIQSRFFRLERQYLHYYNNETDFHNDEECKDPMDLYAIIGTEIPSNNEGFEGHEFSDIHEVPFDLFTREKQLSIVPDTRWFKAKVVDVTSKGSAKFYNIHWENGDNEEKVPSYRIRIPGEDKEKHPHHEFKKGDKVEAQHNIRQARTLARVLKTWKPRILSGWLMKVNKRGRQQKRWFQLLGSKMSYFESPQDLKQKKEPLNLEFLDSIKNPSPRVKNASQIGAFDLIFAGNKRIPQTMEEKRKAEEEDNRLEAKGAKEHKLTFSTLTVYPAQNDPSTKSLVAVLNDWQTHDELRYNVNKWHILKCRIRSHPATAFGVVVTDVDPYKVKTGYAGHTKPGVRITQLLSLPTGDLGPAEMAGVMLNDTIVEIDGRKIFRVQDAAKALKDKQSGTFTLCRLGDVTPESMMRMKRSMLTKEQIEAEKTMKSKEEASERRKKAAQRQESARSRHGHRHHRGKKATFGALKARTGWREGRSADGKAYWYHTNGMITFTEPAKSEILGDCVCGVRYMTSVVTRTVVTETTVVGGSTKTSGSRSPKMSL
eukprot:g318.t1